MTETTPTEEVKQELVVVYLKNELPNNVRDTIEYDRCMVRKWMTNCSSSTNWNLIIKPIMPYAKTWREHMDEIFEEVKDHKYFIVIVGIGCHSTKYFVDRISTHVESPAHLTLLGICDKINLQHLVMVPKPAVTLNLKAIRNCYTSNELNRLTTDCASVKRTPNGLIELGYIEQLNVEIEHRPATLDEKFNALMFGGLSNLTPYWDITPIYIDPVETPPVDRSDAMEMKEVLQDEIVE